MIKEALVEIGMEKIAHMEYDFDYPYMRDQVDEFEDYMNQNSDGSGTFSTEDINKFQKWKNEIKPSWDKHMQDRKNDPKVQKFESLIEQAEGERKTKLKKKLQEYVDSNIQSPVDKDGTYQGLKKKLERAKRKEFTNDKFTPEGKNAHRNETIDKYMGKGGATGALLGGAFGGTMGFQEGRSLRSRLAKGLVGGAAGTIAGTGLGFGAGVGAGLIGSPLKRPFEKNKAKYNKKGLINKRKNELSDRERYLRQGHNMDY